MPKERIDYMVRDRPIAIYDTSKQKLIGVFKTLPHLVKYLKPTDPQNGYRCLIEALSRRGCVKNTIFNFKVALRFANNEQALLLEDKEAHIEDGYKKLVPHQLKGFDGRIDQKWLKRKK